MWPINGFGAFMEKLQGEVAICIVNNPEMMERSATLMKGTRTLVNIPGDNFTKCMASCKFTVLTAGSTLWVPYGCQALLFPREEYNIYHLLYVPFVNGTVLKHTAKLREQMAFMTDAAKANAALPHTVLHGLVARRWRLDQGSHAEHGKRK